MTRAPKIPPLDWRGQLVGLDADGRQAAALVHEPDAGWRAVIVGSAVNDDGVEYQWSRQAVDAAGQPVAHASVEDAMAAAAALGPEFAAEHEAAEEARRELQKREHAEAAAAALVVVDAVEGDQPA